MPMERIEAWLRVRDGQRYSRDMRDAAKSTRSVGEAAAATGRNAAWMGQQGHRARQSMLLMGQASRWAAFGLGIAGAGAVKMGIEFNSTMEQNEVALDQFLRSGERTNKMLDELFQIAAKTPFEFRDVTTAARKFLAFGFKAKQTTRYLMSVGNAVAGIGGGNDEIQRAIIALGQMQAKGKVMGQELLQLTELGIPAYKILKEELGLTGDQMKRVGDQGIPARKGIEAIMRGMDKRFAGAAQRQSKTMAGQWSTFKDYFRQTMGALTRPLFDIVRKTILPAFIKLMPQIQKVAPKIMQNFWAGLTGGKAGKGGGQVGKIAQNVGNALKGAFAWMKSAFPVAKQAVMDLFNAFKPAMPFVQNVVLPLLKGIAIGVGITLVGLFKIAIFTIGILAKILGWLGKKAEPIKPVFTAIGIVLGLLFTGPILKALTFLPKLGGLFGFLGKAVDITGAIFSKVFGFIFGIFSKFFGIIGKVLGFFGFFIGKWLYYHKLAWMTVFKTWFKVVGFVVTLPIKFFKFAVKIGSSIVKGLGSAVKWVVNAVRNPMNDALGFLAGLPPKVFNLGVRIAKALIRGIKSLFAAGMGFAAGIGKTIANAVIGFLNSAIPNKLPIPGAPDINLPDNPIPRLARGGHLRRGGWSWVGEHGPEPVWLPAGADVHPSNSLVARIAPRGGGMGSAKVAPLAEPLMAGELGSVHSYAGMTEGIQGGDDEGGRRPQVIQLVVGRKVLAEVVADEAEDRKARR